MKRRVLQALQARAERELGEGAGSLEYVRRFVAGGGRISELAARIGDDLGHPVSRSFLSYTVNRLAPDAKQQLRAARLSTGSAHRPAELFDSEQSGSMDGGMHSILASIMIDAEHIEGAECKRYSSTDSKTPTVSSEPGNGK